MNDIDGKQIILDYLDTQSDSELFVIYRLSSDTFESVGEGSLNLFTKEQVCISMLAGPFADMVIYEINDDRVIDYFSPVVIGYRFAEEVDYFANSICKDGCMKPLDEMFRNCNSFCQDIGSWDLSKVTNMSKWGV